MGDRLLMLLNPQHGQFFKIACECLQGLDLNLPLAKASTVFTSVVLNYFPLTIIPYISGQILVTVLERLLG